MRSLQNGVTSFKQRPRRKLLLVEEYIIYDDNLRSDWSCGIERQVNLNANGQICSQKRIGSNNLENNCGLAVLLRDEAVDAAPWIYSDTAQEIRLYVRQESVLQERDAYTFEVEGNKWEQVSILISDIGDAITSIGKLTFVCSNPDNISTALDDLALVQSTSTESSVSKSAGEAYVKVEDVVVYPNCY